jgi:hypothetical protein
VDGDKYPILKSGECYIVNRKSNEHWVAVANINGKNYTYDSFNRPDYLGGFQSGDVDGYPDQSYSQENCGQRTLAWLTTILSL